MTVFLFTVLAAIDLFFLVCQEEDLIQSLLDGCDTAGILAADHVGDLFRKLQGFFLGDLVVTDDIDGDVVVNVAQNIQVNVVDRALNLDDVLAAHLVASRVLDDGYLTVGETVKTKVIVNVKAFASLNMIQNNAFL